MYLKVRNFIAVVSLSLLVLGNSVLANPFVSEKTPETKAVVVDPKNDTNYYNDILVSGGNHTYTVKVDKKAKIRFRSSREATLKVTTPNGEVKTYNDKYFDVNLLTDGEYTLEVSSLFISQYSLEIFKR